MLNKNLKFESKLTDLIIDRFIIDFLIKQSNELVIEFFKKCLLIKGVVYVLDKIINIVESNEQNMIVILNVLS